MRQAISFGLEDILCQPVGRDEEMIRRYIRHQEQEEKKLEQLNLFRA